MPDMYDVRTVKSRTQSSIEQSQEKQKVSTPTFKVEFPLHEVATNSKSDIVANLRAVANKLESLSEEQAFQPFNLDQETVASLDYISYGVVGF